MKYKFIDEVIFDGNFKALSNCKKKSIFLIIVKKYKQACLKLSLFDKISSFKECDAAYCNVDDRQKEVYYLIIDFFDTIISKLKKDYQDIIINDFINEEEKNWYLKEYSRSTYYRMKMEAINEFLFYAL